MCIKDGVLFGLQEVHFDLDFNYKAHVNLIYINMHETALMFQILTTLHWLDDDHWRKHMGTSTIHTHISKIAHEGGAKGEGFFHISFVPNMFILCSLQWVPIKFPICFVSSLCVPQGCSQ
jgi:hypothetical protein